MRNTSPIRWVLPSLTICCLLLHFASADENPQSYSIKRYAVIWQNSFFAKSSMGKSGNQSSSDYWSLSGVFSFRGGHGAVIVNNTTGQIQQIETGKKNESGLSLIRVEGLNTDDPLKVKVANREGDTFWVLNKRER